MFLLKRLSYYFKHYYLLAATAGIIILCFLGSVNVMLITQEKPVFMGWVGLLFTIIATMRFLAFFLAQYPRKRIIESLISGVILQLVILIIVLLN